MSSPEQQQYIQDGVKKVDSIIAFAIEFLTVCEARKTWVKLTGPLSMTCGYTAPGIGILLQLFRPHNISSAPELERFLQHINWPMDQFIFIVNETIGNLLDMIPECPVTQTQYGIRGLLVTEYSEQKIPGCGRGGGIVYKVEPGGANLVEGANIISFARRIQHCETFHHAVIYKISQINACYIIDSWVEPRGIDCRPLSSRRHIGNEVYAIIDELNSDIITRERTYEILTTYFRGHFGSIGQMLQMTDERIMVNTISPGYIQHVYTQCENIARTGQPSSFGGKKRNKSKSKNKSRKRSKKYSRMSNRKHRIYRQTHVKYNRG